MAHTYWPNSKSQKTINPQALEMQEEEERRKHNWNARMSLERSR